MKTRTFIYSTLATAVCAAMFYAGATSAQDVFKNGPSVFNYNFVELKYLDADGGEGIGLVGSGDIRENIALRFDYLDANGDSLRLGATYYRQSMRYPRADLNFSAGIDRIEDEGGVFAAVGGRYALSDPIELNATIELNTIVDTDLNVQLGGFYEFSPGLSGLLQATLGDNTVISVGVRFYWR